MHLNEILFNNKDQFSWLFDLPFSPEKGLRIRLGNNNPAMNEINIRDMKNLELLIQKWVTSNNRLFAYGGYGENREFYKRSELFTGPEYRTIHLGIDFWLPEYTPVYLPLDGVVHSSKKNTGKGNYGPTIITKHHLDGQYFHILWGHLSTGSLNGINPDLKLKKGQNFCFLGDYNENGEWPAHLHMQIIEDLQDNKGDYPGVASMKESRFLLNNCPDPGIVFNLS